VNRVRLLGIGILAFAVFAVFVLVEACTPPSKRIPWEDGYDGPLPPDTTKAGALVGTQMPCRLGETTFGEVD
jgi:hypothetical protein